MCIGQHFAAQALFVNIATFLWAFDFQKEIDAFGCPITPDVNAVLDSGLVLCVVLLPTYDPAQLTCLAQSSRAIPMCHDPALPRSQVRP